MRRLFELPLVQQRPLPSVPERVRAGEVLGIGAWLHLWRIPGVEGEAGGKQEG
jgi:hypothetical protein